MQDVVRIVENVRAEKLLWIDNIHGTYLALPWPMWPRG